MIWKRDEEEPHERDERHEREGRHERHERERQERAEAHETRGGSMAEQGEVTVIGQGARLEGTIVSAGSLRIDGQVKGKIQADGDVILSAQSSVEADITADNVTVSGRFKGNITVKSTAELARGGRVDGNITSKSLVISEGATFSGQSIMGEAATRATAPPAGSSSAPAQPPASDGAPKEPEKALSGS
jgi:cytoskeletal protein CcmA (bactofilin family)